GTESIERRMYSIDFDCRSGYFSSASFSLFVYAAWCLSWWISIVRASMCGSRALVAYGRSGSLKGYAIFELSSRLSAVRHAHGWICLSPCAKQGSGTPLAAAIRAPDRTEKIGAPGSAGAPNRHDYVGDGRVAMLRADVCPLDCPVHAARAASLLSISSNSIDSILPSMESGSARSGPNRPSSPPAARFAAEKRLSHLS